MQKITLLVIALVLLSGIALSAPSEEEPATASVTVNTFVSITLIDYNSGGIVFGSLNPGTSDNAADQNTTDGTIKVKNDPVSNKSITVEIKGTDFTAGAETITVGNAKWDIDNSVASATNLSTTYVTVASVVTAGSAQNVWSWLSIPVSQKAGSYTSTYTFKGS